MYRHIYVPIDNSEWSNRAADLAVELGRAFGARLTGCHVYAARLHHYRFKQMEYTLPEPYQDEVELERQRTLHDSLIALGLRLISESYLDVVARKAEAAALPFEGKLFDGRHYKVLIQDARASGYDLVVIGALGMGAVKESQIGSVTERFVRHVAVDTLVVRNTDPHPGSIVVGLDGSPQSFYALKVGLVLAKALCRPVEAVAVCEAPGTTEPRLLQVDELGRKLAREQGVELAITLLRGHGFAKLLDYCRKERPWLLILGRVGADSVEGQEEPGSSTQRLLRLAPVNVLVTAAMCVPPAGVGAEPTPR